jgi:hypothetical protein
VKVYRPRFLGQPADDTHAATFVANAAQVDAELDIAQGGLPNFLIVGLSDAAVQEARIGEGRARL